MKSFISTKQRKTLNICVKQQLHFCSAKGISVNYGLKSDTRETLTFPYTLASFPEDYPMPGGAHNVSSPHSTGILYICIHNEEYTWKL